MRQWRRFRFRPGCDRPPWPSARRPTLVEVQASGGARSEPVPLLHPRKGSSDALTARIHATENPTLALVARPYPGFLHELSIDPDLADAAGNASDGVHIASAAGAWKTLVFGFGGVRDFDGALSIAPRLPTQWRSLAFSLRFGDRQLRIELTHDEERYLESRKASRSP